MNTLRPARLPWILGILLLVASLGGAALVLQNTRDLAAGPNDSDAKVRNHTGQGVFCQGRVDIEGGQVPLVPSQPGAVVEVYCSEGQSVKKGDRLLKVNEAPFLARLAEAEAGVKSAEGQLAEARQGIEQYESALKAQEAAVKLAREQLADSASQRDRGERLLKLNIPNITEQEVSTLRQKVRIAEAAVLNQEAVLEKIRATRPDAKIQQAQGQLDSRKSQVDQAREALDRCTLKAPQDGRVLRVQAAVGSQYGSQPSHPAVEFAPTGPWVVRCNVDQEFTNRVTLGAEAMIQDEAIVGPVWRGKVFRIGDAYLPPRSNGGPDLLSTGSNARVLEVLVSIEPAQTMPRLNQLMRVSIGTSR